MPRLTSVPALAAATLTAVLALAGPAAAHVTVNPSTATAGSYAKLTFRVPTESDTASTTKVAVFFPADQPFASASVKPHPGWTFKVTTEKLATPISSDDGQVTEAVKEIVWTATSPASQVRPGEFDEFDVSVGPLPASGTVTFKALQYYSDGSVVRWIDTPVAGQPEPEHPAPVLTLTPAGSVGGDAGTSSTASPQVIRQSPSHTPLVLATMALVVAVAALALSVLARRRD